jgi:hypothetical protein
MRSTSSWGLHTRALLAVLVLPLVLVPGITYFALSGSGDAGLPMATGSFHPVAGGFRPDDTALAECDGEWACLEQAFGNVAYREGPKRALALFEERLASDPEVDRDCHRIVHTIGSATLERNDGNIARTFAQGSPSCVSGFYHGILERAFLDLESKGQLGDAARSLCLGADLRRRGFLDYQCRHGLGHGLMIQTGYDLPLALSVCAGLGTGWDRKACASGAFMENVNTRFGYRSSWLDDEDPLYPCDVVRVLDRHSCYLRASWRILTLNGGNYEETAAACTRLDAWAATCLRGYGRDVAEKARYAPGAIRPLCQLAGAGEGDCLLGAARTIANASGFEGVALAARLCAGASSSGQAQCYTGLGLVLGMLYPTGESRRAACRKLTSEHVDTCAAAAKAEVDPSGRDSWG